jgi:hypothetical protein
MTPDPGNHGVSRRVETGYAAGFIAPNPDRDMAYYDALPREVRQALDDAPWGISAEAAYHCVRTQGVVHALREVRESVDAFFAAFEAETGVPRPVKPLGRGVGVKSWRR